MSREKMPMGNIRSPFSITKNNQLHLIKETITPQAFYAKELRKIIGKKMGWVDGGLCPFHLDKQEGSFRVNLTSGAFKCFSCSASGGDVIAFTMRVYGLSFPAALAKLTNEWEISC